MKTLTLAAYLAAVALLWGCATAHERSFPKTWRGVVMGMNREDVHRMIGPPDAPRVSPFQEIWVTREWELDLDYDHHGRVTNIVQQYLLR